MADDSDTDDNEESEVVIDSPAYYPFLKDLYRKVSASRYFVLQYFGSAGRSILGLPRNIF